MKFKILVAIVLLAFVALGVSSIVNRDNKIQLKEIELQSKQSEIKQLKIDYELLDKRQDELIRNHSKDKKELEKVRKEKEELLERQRQLEREVSAKKEAQRLAREKLNDVSHSVASVVVPSVGAGGSCESWIASAGIGEVSMANELIRRESGCNPYAVNASSGACGVAQELPCGKSGCASGDGGCQVRWMNSYIISRYGSWSSAVAFHSANNWY